MRSSFAPSCCWKNSRTWFFSSQPSTRKCVWKSVGDRECAERRSCLMTTHLGENILNLYSSEETDHPNAHDRWSKARDVSLSTFAKQTAAQETTIFSREFRSVPRLREYIGGEFRSLSSSAASSDLFREYIGGEFKGVKFSDVPINPGVEFHFILSFAIDYPADGSSSTESNFNVFWDTYNLSPAQVAAIKQSNSNVRVALSLGGDSVGNGLSHGFISFASIAPFDGDQVQKHYFALWNKYGSSIDYVNFQFYAYDSSTTVSQFLGYFENQSSNYRGGKLLASFSTDSSSDGLSPVKGFFNACRTLKMQGKLSGIFVWSADDSLKNSFSYERTSQNLLAGSP
ncbi:hypothetical protein KSP40_PGU000260 [Platanthera guangdongensis]|uniref:GH18 domain-containing protein n=1 Tax=Platanthera guangdongensis TaxID=2320717 RepID=A0ABR2MSC2_9ASPA